MFQNTHHSPHSHHGATRGDRQHSSGRHGGRGRSRSFMGGDGAPFGRKLSSNDLQLILLALLAEQPAHGYELIRTLEERSNGFYSPSSGMMYPALLYMEEIGQTQSTSEANRKLYTITEPGQAFLTEHRQQADAILDALTRIGGRMEEVRDALAGVEGADPRASDALHAARHALKRALIRKHDCTPDESRRLAGILDRATAEILGVATRETTQ